MLLDLALILGHTDSAMANHAIWGRRRLLLSGAGGAIIGGFTGAAALSPVALSIHLSSLLAFCAGAIVGAVGGFLTGLIAGDT